jgi:hypothetical protein
LLLSIYRTIIASFTKDWNETNRKTKRSTVRRFNKQTVGSTDRGISGEAVGVLVIGFRHAQLLAVLVVDDLHGVECLHGIYNSRVKIIENIKKE